MRQLKSILILFLVVYGYAQPNLITNPGAELVPLTLNGWTEGCFNAACDWTGTPPEKDNAYGLGTETHTGAGHFYPGDNNWTNGDSLYQIVDISAYSSAIDAGTASFTFSAWMSIYRPNNDRARVAWSFLNGSGTTLRYTTSGNLFYNGVTGTPGLLTWHQYSSTIVAPVGSRSIRISMFAVYNSGSAADSYYDDLSLTTTASLPVSLISFKSEVLSSEVLLKWNTSDETNNSHFTVQKSFDGENWFEIGTVNGNGTTNVLQSYQFSDSKPRPGKQYYRLIQSDFNGTSKAYEAMAVDFQQEFAVQVAPNPVAESLTIKTSEEITHGTIKLIDARGQLLVSTNMSGNELQLNMQAYPAGWYTIELINESKISRITIIKE